LCHFKLYKVRGKIVYKVSGKIVFIFEILSGLKQKVCSNRE